MLSTLSSLCIAYFEKELGETLHVQYINPLSHAKREKGRGRKRKIGSRFSDDLPLQRRYRSSVLRLLSLMGQKENTVEIKHTCVLSSCGGHLMNQRAIKIIPAHINVSIKKRGIINVNLITPNLKVALLVLKQICERLLQQLPSYSPFDLKKKEQYICCIWFGVTIKPTIFHKIKQTYMWKSFE